MASRRFFTYDPYDYYYTSPLSSYLYDDPDYQLHPASTRTPRGFFANDDPNPKAATVGTKPKAKTREAKISIPIPVHGPDTDPEPKQERKRKPAGPVAPAMPVDVAAVRMQAAARGLLVRKSVREVRDVERVAKLVESTIAGEGKAILADERARVLIGEGLMRLLLRLDAVGRARVYRRKVTKRVVQLQDAVDALALALKEAEAPDVTEEMAEESAVAPELPVAVEYSSGMEEGLETQMEVGEEAVADGEPEAEKEAVPGEANVDADDVPEDLDAEGEWELVTEEHTAPAAATSHDHEVLPCQEEEQEQADPSGTPKTTESAGASDGVDMRQVMEMVAALCKQCAVIGALAERVDALERTVRRMEDAKKMSKEINDTEIYSD